MEKKEIRSYYTERINALSAELESRKARVKYFITAEISLFVIGVGMGVAYFSGYIPTMEFIALFCLPLALFKGIKVADGNNSRRIEDSEAHLGVYRDNMRYMDGDHSKGDDGCRFINPNHQYAYDMDIFGEHSLFQRICRTVTSGGNDRLAQILSECGLPLSEGGAKVADINRRRAAIAELAGMEPWRTDFLATGYGKKVDTEAIRRAIEETRNADIPQGAASRRALVMAAASMVVFIALLLLAVFTPVSADWVCSWTVVQLALSIGTSAKAIKTISKSVEKINSSMKAYIELLKIISAAGFKEEGNMGIAGRIGGTALGSLKELKGILDALDRRANVLGLIIFNALAYSDFFLVRRYLMWQKRNMEAMQVWIDAVSELDAMVSMATMRYNEPQAVDADIVDTDKIIYEAKGVYHPFLGEKAVRNDFSVVDGNYYIITGANMAGKSTFLRSIGINYVMALCGMPVFAEKLRVSLYNLFSSMRTNDDLAHGISYFNAELLRLRQLLDNVKAAPRTLIILDEILKGTNSLDKLNGSRMFLEAIAKLPVSGIIATHDLELSKLADEYHSRFHNFCFEIKLSQNIKYSYKISPGIAKNQNATYLLKGILEDK